jgi:DNA (cytosine-5)-methyltransferase 1
VKNGMATRPRELSLFSGAGGGLLATHHLLGWRTVCYVEREPYCVEVLKARIQDGLLDDAPIWDDVRTFDGRPWRGCVDIITGGDPCQANSNARPFKSTHDSFGDEFLRIVTEIRPTAVIRENPYQVTPDAPWPADRFARGLEYLGFATAVVAVRACCLGANHRRERLFVLGFDTHGNGEPSLQADPAEMPQRVPDQEAPKLFDSPPGRAAPRMVWPVSEADLHRTLDDVAHRMDRIRACGNGQVPIVAATAWRLLTEE